MATYSIGDRVEIKAGESAGKSGVVCATRGMHAYVRADGDEGAACAAVVPFADLKPEGAAGAPTEEGTPDPVANAKFKVGDKVRVDPQYGSNVDIGFGNNVGIVKAVGSGDVLADFKDGGVVRVPIAYCSKATNACSSNPVVNAAVSYAEVSRMLKLADGCVADGDLAEAKEILRETKSAASRTGLASEWKRIAAKAGVK